MKELFAWRCETCIVRPMCTEMCILVKKDKAFKRFFESIEWNEYRKQLEERSIIHIFGKIKYGEKKEICYNLDNITST